MAEAVRVLVAGLPAEIVREIGLRIRGATVTEFENTQQMGRAAGQGEAELIILSDTLPVSDALYITRRAKDASDEVRIAYCISMAQAEATLHSLEEMHVDRFFLLPVDMEEMLRELAKMCRFEVLAPRLRRTVRISPRQSTMRGIEPAAPRSRKSTRWTMRRSRFWTTAFPPN